MNPEPGPSILSHDLIMELLTLPGPDGWWHEDNHDTYSQLAILLVGKGFTEQEALEILGSAYGAAADEFGA